MNYDCKAGYISSILGKLG